MDGQLTERNSGQHEHSILQGEILAWFRDRRQTLRVRAFPEHRIQIRAGRYRVPDVCVMELPSPDDAIFTQPSYICIEVLSPDDTLSRMRQRIEDYREMGVRNIWLIDSESRQAFLATEIGILDVPDGILRTGDGRVEMPVASLVTGYE